MSNKPYNKEYKKWKIETNKSAKNREQELVDARYSLFKEKYGDEALELAIELGFDKEELLNNI